MQSKSVALGTPTLSASSATSSRMVSRMTGALYLVIIVSGIFAHFLVRGSLVVPGNAGVTAANIIASEQLFRFGIVGDIVMILSDVAVGVLFYVLLKAVNKTLALLAALLRLVQATFLGVNLLNLWIALQLLSGAPYLAPLGLEQAQTLALLFLGLFNIGYSLALVFFALSILLVGVLIVQSTYIPRILGILLVLASVGYLVDSLAQVLLLNYGVYADLFGTVVFVPALIAELSLAIWLVVKGVRLPASRPGVA